MRIIYLFIAVVLFSVSFTSCTAEDVSDSVKTTQYADDDLGNGDDTGGETGGQTGTINPPPPPTPAPTNP
ncbi:MAG: hypothetical protein CMP76_14170 [Flavobacterium sp.]|uniref:hypothetical protein n=1 Tax=Flavobacterium sp. TaxID=239 RepID=UPI000C5B61D8|nr:hypothetical protein [Flavobacterium sp.]MBF04428.1 hypothetical protein [Flavobacterium sp.]|tara:strand:+ start:1088 stop:1297 length:210 start_codon:yes stop_codon:yes gene_type:complete